MKLPRFWPKPFQLKDLNQTLVKRNPVRTEAMMDTCNFVNEAWFTTSTHRWLIGDCILLKFNLIKKKQVRVNKRRIEIPPHVDGPAVKLTKRTIHLIDAARLQQLQRG